MRIAMFEGYGFGAAGDTTGDAVEALIRQNVAVLQGVQGKLWAAHSNWRSNRFLTGLAFPAAIILRIGSFDWGYAVNAWQGSVDTWWNSRMTDAVRSAPYEVGADGKTRVQAWIDMGQKLITWAEDIAKRMGDDTLVSDLQIFRDHFIRTVKIAIDAGVDIVASIVPGWLKWGAIAGIAFILVVKFVPSRR